MKVPAFSDIGKDAKELLYGGRTTGIFQYDRKLTVNAKTSHAVDFALNSTTKNGALAMITKATIKSGPLSVEVIASDPKVTLTGSQIILEGLKATLTGSVPDIQNSGKLTLDYAHPYFTGKAVCSLNAAPKLDLSAAAGYSGFVVGADASVDITKSTISKWTAAASFIGTEFIVAGHLLDGANTVKGTYYQKVDAASSIGTEIVHSKAANKVNIALGYSNTAFNGDVRKVKISNDGTVDTLYEFKPRPELIAALSVQINTTDFGAPKMGLALEYNP